MEDDNKDDALSPMLRAASETAKTFQLVVKSGPVAENHRHDLNNQHARFKIWRSTISSIISTQNDAAFGDAAVDVLLSMLARLLQKLHALTETPEPIPEPDEGSSAASLILDSTSESTDSDTKVEAEPTRHPDLAFIDSIISRLYRYTTFIQQPKPPNEMNSLLDAFEKVSLDDEEAFENIVRQFLERKCPRLSQSPKLFERHLNASKGRRKILCRTDADKGKFIRDFSLTSELYDDEVSGETLKRWDKLAFPPCPFQKGNKGHDFVCPYCGLDISDRFESSEERWGQHWKRHVLHDIAPYTCLFPECERGNLPFNSVDSWLQHMKEHTSVFFCQYPNHESVTFTSCDNLASHLMDAHPETIPSNLAHTIARLGEHPSQDILAHLFLEWNKDMDERKNFVACMFCEQRVLDIAGQEDMSVRSSDLTLENLPQPMQRAILGHLLQHLEAIALLSLPEIETRTPAATSASSAISSIAESTPVSRPPEETLKEYIWWCCQCRQSWNSCRYTFECTNFYCRHRGCGGCEILRTASGQYTSTVHFGA